MEYYFDEKNREYVVSSGINTLRLSEKEFRDIADMRVSGILSGLRKKTSF